MDGSNKQNRQNQQREVDGPGEETERKAVRADAKQGRDRIGSQTVQCETVEIRFLFALGPEQGALNASGMGDQRAELRPLTQEGVGTRSNCERGEGVAVGAEGAGAGVGRVRPVAVAAVRRAAAASAGVLLSCSI